jgi:hypothetical protein
MRYVRISLVDQLYRGNPIDHLVDASDPTTVYYPDRAQIVIGASAAQVRDGGGRIRGWEDKATEYIFNGNRHVPLGLVTVVTR